MFVSEETAQQRARAEQQRRAAALAAGGALVVGVAASGDGEAGGGAPAAARAKAAGVILAAVMAFFSLQRDRLKMWLRGAARARQPGVPEDAIEALVLEEQKRGEVFEQKSLERFARDLTVVLAIPDAAQRDAAMRGLVKREERYGRQREEAMAARLFAAVDRVVIKAQSPQGGFWRLDPTVVEHTAACLFMGGKFWPWAVLDRVHPPRHGGCPCRLLGFGEAVAEGLMGPGDVQDVRKAVLRAAAVIMEGALVLDDQEAAMALIEEAYGSAEVAGYRQAVVAAGLVSAEGFDAALLEAGA